MPGDDALSFHFAGISMIRDDDEYGGFQVSLSAVFTERKHRKTSFLGMPSGRSPFSPPSPASSG
jgi:hypothetical protein